MATDFLTKYKSIAPLVVFRVAFGAALFISTARFIAKGWIDEFYIHPRCHFPFMNTDWLHIPGGGMLFGLYFLMAAAALFICIGFFYRIATVIFFSCFFYTTLLDKTYYLNHYYLVSILSFLLMLVPANRFFSVDVIRKPSLAANQVPAWTIGIFRLQLCIVYFFAGLSKLTSDWLIDAMPLKVWLLAKTNVPVIGPLFQYAGVAYFFSWAGALFDLSVPFLLLIRKTRPVGYLLVIVFHLLTTLLFQIGMFPWFMITSTLIFFSGDVHVRILLRLKVVFKNSGTASPRLNNVVVQPVRKKILFGLLAAFFIFQLLFPLRFLLYPGRLLWTEEGYRFSWRVMLMEKSGTAFFYVEDSATGHRFQVNNSEFLTPYQERMMETQPDMILQYASILKKHFTDNGIVHPKITTECYVSLNCKGSRLLIDSSVNLANQPATLFGHQQWILPYGQQ